MKLKNIEREFFRGLNFVVEPLVRSGIASPTFTPTSLILLETTGFKSGLKRRTPLLALRLGKYTLVSTGRGKRSFWVKNLQRDPHVDYYLGGRARGSLAHVMASGTRNDPPKTFPLVIKKIAEILRNNAPEGWVFVILAPR
jgi:deazaflavin-dependent oxidoreductase (nitroreductase family)